MLKYKEIYMLLHSIWIWENAKRKTIQVESAELGLVWKSYLQMLVYKH